MRLIQFRNILLTCLYQTRKLSGPVFVCYMHGTDFASVYNVPTVWYLCSDSVVSVFGFHFISGKILCLAAAQKTLHIVYNHTLSSTDRHAYISFVFLLKYYWYHAPTISFHFPYLLSFVGYLSGNNKA